VTRNTIADNGHVLDVGRIDPDPAIGDLVVATTTDPVIDSGAHPARHLDVLTNWTLARHPDGERCIRVKFPADGLITVAEAHELSLDLQAARDAIAGIRTDLGYER